MRMYHPSLGREIDVPDNDRCIAVHAEAGWKPATEPKSDNPALAPEPTVYGPVDVATPTSRKKTASGS